MSAWFVITAHTGEIIDDDLEAMTVTSTKYRLIGVVVHSGQASGGHYYSYIFHRYICFLMIHHTASTILLILNVDFKSENCLLIQFSNAVGINQGII